MCARPPDVANTVMGITPVGAPGHACRIRVVLPLVSVAEVKYALIPLDTANTDRDTGPEPNDFTWSGIEAVLFDM